MHTLRYYYPNPISNYLYAQIVSCATGTTASALPVKLVSFDATLNKSKVDLKWTTASEQNVGHFIVERSTDGTNFTEAGIVFTANENSSQNINYSMNDDISSMKANIFYYRLCTVDMDGKMQYSDIRVIRISNQTNNNLAIMTYPNPVIDELRITIPSTWQNKKVSYELFNVNGQLSKRVEEGSSSQTETINVSKLTTGMYIMKVICEGQSIIQKVIKF